jgi:hypothetical protein
MGQEIKFSPEVLKRLDKIRKDDYHTTWALLGADEKGIVQDFEVVEHENKCYTPTLLSSQINTAMLALYKRKMVACPGFFIVDSEGGDPNGSGRGDVTAWFNSNAYAFRSAAVQAPGMIFVKKHLQSDEPTACIVKAITGVRSHIRNPWGTETTSIAVTKTK